jgi:hypothetical protein
VAIQSGDVNNAVRDGRRGDDRPPGFESPLHTAQLLRTGRFVDSGVGVISVEGVLCKAGCDRSEQSQDCHQLHPLSPDRNKVQSSATLDVRRTMARNVINRSLQLAEHLWRVRCSSTLATFGKFIRRLETVELGWVGNGLGVGKCSTYPGTPRLSLALKLRT